MGYDLLFALYDRVEAIGWPIALAAWLTVFVGAVGVGLALRRMPVRGHLRAAVAVGGVCLLAHAADIATTLWISPDLAIEGNPIWLVVLETGGLRFALLYGITGKLLVGVLNGQCYLLYRVLREGLFPAEAESFGAFVRRFGAAAPARFGIAPRRVGALFAYVFGWLGLFSFYVAALNVAGDRFPGVHERLPSPLPVTVGYGLLLAAGFYVESWRAFRARSSRSASTAQNSSAKASVSESPRA